MQWQNKPSKIKFWSNDVDYAMFVDENGSEGKVKAIFKAILNNKEIDDDDRYFTITGCIFEKPDYKKAVKDMDLLKKKYWKNGQYFDTKLKKYKYVCFHSREIRRHNAAFNDRLINHKDFENDLSNTLKNVNCILIRLQV